jgi:hypothetical protein
MYVHEPKLWTCYVLIGIKHYEFNGEVSNIATHGKGKGANVPKFMFIGISFDHINMKIGAPNVESNFTCHSL